MSIFSDDHIWGVVFSVRQSIHGVKGAGCRVTLCGLDFIDTPWCPAPLPITCKHCLTCIPAQAGNRELVAAGAK